MNNLHWIALIALAESTLLLALLLALGVTLLRRRKRHENEAADKLIARISENSAERESELRSYLSREFALNEAELQEQLERMLALETRFYDELHRIWRERDREGLQDLDQHLHAIFTSHAELRRPSVPVETEAPAPPEIEDLKAQLEQSAEELQRYRDTLNTVFNEYTAMFGSRNDSKEQLTAEEIMQRLKEGVTDR